MKKRVITISREFGSGGRYIGKQLADKLGIAFYDKELILKTAEETGLSQDFIEKKGEYSPAKNIFSYGFVGRTSTGMSMDDYLYTAQRKIILELAENEPCVIVGRCADYILRERTDCIHAFIHGNPEEKKKRICSLYGETESCALKLMKEMDKKRSIHYKYHTDLEWGNTKNYTMALNSSELGYDLCIRLLAEAAE